MLEINLKLHWSTLAEHCHGSCTPSAKMTKIFELLSGEFDETFKDPLKLLDL